jgi:hypothetical protein
VRRRRRGCSETTGEGGGGRGGRWFTKTRLTFIEEFHWQLCATAFGVVVVEQDLTSVLVRRDDKVVDKRTRGVVYLALLKHRRHHATTIFLLPHSVLFNERGEAHV